MRKAPLLYLSLFLTITPFLSLPVLAQTQVGSAPIWYTSVGNVGIGTSSPASPLTVMSGVDQNLTSTNYVAALYFGFTNDYGAGGPAQYLLLMPQYPGSVVQGAGLAGTLRAVRGNNGAYNSYMEYKIIGQTAWETSTINAIPQSLTSLPLNIYSVTYQGSPFLAILGSDIAGSGSQWTFSGYIWNNINTIRPQIVLASACSNVSVWQNTTYLAGSYLTANANGNVGVGTGITTAQAPLHVGGEGVSPDNNNDYTADLVVQANTGGRNTSVGAELEFALPANTDGTNMWGQGRIITVPGNTNTGDATGTMIFGTRRLFNKLGTSVQWYYGNDLTIDGNGRIGINTGNTQGYQLAVNGNAIFTQAVVKNYANWPDYVFANDYRPWPLDTLSDFIHKWQHLPGVPDAQTIHQEGLDLGKIQTAQMQKIEELTLYAIDANKRLHAQDSVISAQQAQLKTMEQMLEGMKTRLDKAGI